MKVFEIRDNIDIYGYLFCVNNYSDYYIEINSNNLNQDVFFKMFLDKKENTINYTWARRFIEERVIPANRQNINDILLNNGMNEYNELEMFIASNGRSSMDNTYLRKIKEEDIIEEIRERRKRRIIDFIQEENKLIVFFMDGASKLYEITNQDDLKYINNTDASLSVFGNEIIFNSKVRFSYDYLYANGKYCDISYSGILNYMNKNLIRNSDISEELNISRQGVNKKLKSSKFININNNYLRNELVLYKGNH